MDEKQQRLRELIRRIIKKELDEMTTTGNVAGFLTPFAFRGNKKSQIARSKHIATDTTGFKLTPRGQQDLKRPADKMEIVKNIVDNYLNDIVFEGDKIYYDADKDDLDQIFYDGRDGDRYIVNKILSLDDDWWEPYSDVVDDRSFFNECIGELTNENKMLLSNRLNDELLDVKVNPNTDLLEEIAQEQGHEDYVLLDVDLIHDRILEDEETTKFLLLYETDLGNELMWRYNDAYNQVAVDGYYNQVMDGISTFFNSDKNPELCQ